MLLGRSFGQMVTDLDALKESVVTFASGCAIKLRGQGSVTRAVTVFVTTNRFREDLPQYADSYTEQLSMPTADTLEIVSAAIRALKRIYREGYSYHEAFKDTLGTEHTYTEDHHTDAYYQNCKHLTQLVHLDLERCFLISSLGKRVRDLTHFCIHAGSCYNCAASTVNYCGTHIHHVLSVAQRNILFISET